MSQVEVTQLVKEYKRKKNSGSLGKALKSMIWPEYDILRAVDEVNVTIEAGEAVGYVGPNGSGKSTTIKMLCGILRPTSGTVRIDGLDPFAERIKNNRKIGVVFGNRSTLWWDVPVMESFRLLQRLYEIPKDRFEENIEKFSEIIGIGPLLSVPERQLSLGQRMRCNIAAAFLHDPKIVFLDEPTIGLDAESKAGIRKFIRQINEERKTTFIITSHDFQDIEQLCDRIVLINHGKVVLDDGMSQVRQRFNTKKQIQFEVDQNPWFGKNPEAADGVELLKATPHSMHLEYDTRCTDSLKIINEIAKWCEIQDINITGRDIETIIREVIKEDNRCEEVRG